MAGLNFTRQLLLAKLETTVGTDAVPTAAADAIIVRDATYTIDVQQLERPIYLPDISNSPTRPGRKTVTVAFTAEVKGSGEQGVAPKLGVLLLGCGFAETELAADAGFQYDPVSAAFPSLTLYLYIDGILHKALGCRGSFTLTGTAGEYALVAFTFQGVYVEPVDALFPASPAYEDSLPPIVQNAGLTVNGYEDCAQQFTIAVANTINPILCVNANEGVSGYNVSARNVTGSFNPQASLLTPLTAANKNPFKQLAAGTVGEFDVTIGSETNNICTITGNIQHTGVSPGNRDGALIWDIPFRFVRETGNDEIRFTFPQAA